MNALKTFTGFQSLAFHYQENYSNIIMWPFIKWWRLMHIDHPDHIDKGKWLYPHMIASINNNVSKIMQHIISHYWFSLTCTLSSFLLPLLSSLIVALPTWPTWHEGWLMFTFGWGRKIPEKERKASYHQGEEFMFPLQPESKVLLFYCSSQLPRSLLLCARHSSIWLMGLFGGWPLPSSYTDTHAHSVL